MADRQMTTTSSLKLTSELMDFESENPIKIKGTKPDTEPPPDGGQDSSDRVVKPHVEKGPYGGGLADDPLGSSAEGAFRAPKA